MQARNQEKQGLEEDENSYFFFLLMKSIISNLIVIVTQHKPLNAAWGRTPNLTHYAIQTSCQSKPFFVFLMP